MKKRGEEIMDNKKKVEKERKGKKKPHNQVE